MAKMYAWSRIITDANDHPRDHIQIGDEVSAKDFESKDEFNELVSIGAIRETPYPIPQNKDGSFVHEGSPREYALAQVAEMDQDQYMDAVSNTWNVPQLNDRARRAAEETDADVELPSEEQVAEQEAAEKGQESRQALEAQAGKGSGPSSVTANKATGGKK